MPIFRNHPTVEGALYLKRLPGEPRFEAAVGVDVSITLDRSQVSAVGSGTLTGSPDYGIVVATIEARDANNVAITPAMVRMSWRPEAFTGTGTVASATGSGGTLLLNGTDTVFTDEVAPGFIIYIGTGATRKAATVLRVNSDTQLQVTEGLGTVAGGTGFQVGRLSLEPYIGTGTIRTTGTGNTTLQGTNTAFLSQLATGTEIVVTVGNVQMRATVVSVTNNTTATITSGLGAITTATAYQIAGVQPEVLEEGAEAGTYSFRARIRVATHPDPVFPEAAEAVTQIVTATVRTGGARQGRASARFFLGARRPDTIESFTGLPWIRGIRLSWDTPNGAGAEIPLGYYLFRHPGVPDPNDPNSFLPPQLRRSDFIAKVGGENQNQGTLPELAMFWVTGNSYFDQELDFATPYYYWLFSVNGANLLSLMSLDENGYVIPYGPYYAGHVEDADFLQGSIDIATIAERDTVANALAAGTVTTTKLGVLNVAFDHSRFKSQSRLINGTGTVTAASNVVTGIGTQFGTQIKEGDLIIIGTGDDAQTAEVETVTVTPQRLQVTRPLKAVTNAVAYKIVQDRSTTGTPTDKQYVAWGSITVVNGALGATTTDPNLSPGETTKKYIYFKRSAGTGQGTIVGVDKWNKLVPPTTGTGTLTAVANATALTGIGTAFLTQNIRAGDVLIVTGATETKRLVVAATPTSNTSITVTESFGTALLATNNVGASFKINYTNPPAGTFEAEFVDGEDLLLGINTNGTFKPSIAGTYISGDYLQTNKIDANYIDVTELSTMSADLGTITAGIILDREFEPSAVIRLSDKKAAGIGQNNDGRPVIGSPIKDAVTGETTVNPLQGTVVRRLLDMAASSTDALAVGKNNNRFISVIKQSDTVNGTPRYEDVFYITAGGRALFSGTVDADKILVGKPVAIDETLRLVVNGNAEFQGRVAATEVHTWEEAVGQAVTPKGLAGDTATFVKVLGKSVTGSDQWASIGQYTAFADSEASPVDGNMSAGPVSQGASRDYVLSSSGLVLTTLHNGTTRVPSSGSFTLEVKPSIYILAVISRFDAVPEVAFLDVVVERREGPQGTWLLYQKYGFSYNVLRLYEPPPFEIGGSYTPNTTVIAGLPNVEVMPGGQLIRIYPSQGPNFVESITIPVGNFDPGLPREFRVRVGGQTLYATEEGNKITFGEVDYRVESATLRYKYINSGGGQQTRQNSMYADGGFLYLRPQAAVADGQGVAGEFMVVKTGTGQSATYTPKYYNGTSWTAFGGGTGSSSLTVNSTSGVSTLSFTGATVSTSGTSPNITATVAIPAPYSLPQATASVLGGVTVPAVSGLVVSSGALSINVGTGLSLGVDGRLNLSGSYTSGSGTTDYVARWTGSSQLGNSTIRDNGTYVGIGMAPTSSYKLAIAGGLNATGAIFDGGVTVRNGALFLNPGFGNPAVSMNNGTAALYGTATVANGTSGSLFAFAGALTQGFTGTHPLITSVEFVAPILSTASGSTTITSASTVYIGGAPINQNAQPSNATNNYALLVGAGASRFNGDLTTMGKLTVGNNPAPGSGPGSAAPLRIEGIARSGFYEAVYASGAIYASDFILLDGTGSVATAGPAITLTAPATYGASPTQQTTVLSVLRFTGSGVRVVTTTGGDVTLEFSGGTSGLATTSPATANVIPRFATVGASLALTDSGITDNGTTLTLGRATSVSGRLSLTAGTTSSAPLQLTAGTNLTNAVAGSVEWNGTNLFVTQTTGPTRKTVAYLDSTITGDAANVTGTVAIANGGTGQTSATAAINALLPSQSTNSGRYLTTDGSNVSWATVSAGVTSFNTRTGAVTLSSADVTTALTYTPYNSTNPSGYITSSALSGYATQSYVTSQGYITSSYSVNIGTTPVSLNRASGALTLSGVSLSTLTISTGLTGSSYNGSAGVTIAIDSSVVTTSGSQTLTNKTLTSPTINSATINNAAITAGSAAYKVGGVNYATSDPSGSAGVGVPDGALWVVYTP